jgi:hypothetical protein
MVEEALLQVKSQYPASLGFDQLSSILRQCKDKMEVDVITQKESKK